MKFEIHRQLLITGHEERKEIGNGLIHVHKISHIRTKIHDAIMMLIIPFLG